MNDFSFTPGVKCAELMRAAVITAPGRVEIEAVPIPVPGDGEVRVRVKGCGVCASNLPPWEGREWFTYPMDPGALGHEGWGVVDALGPGVLQLAIGDPVTMLSYHAYAEYDLARSDAVVRLPPTLADRPFPGEPLGCATNIFQRSGILPGDTVAIVGIGFLGVLLTRMAVDAGARVIAIGRRACALDAARQQGAEIAVPLENHWAIIEQVKQATG